MGLTRDTGGSGGGGRLALDPRGLSAEDQSVRGADSHHEGLLGEGEGVKTDTRRARSDRDHFGFRTMRRRRKHKGDEDQEEEEVRATQSTAGTS